MPSPLRPAVLFLLISACLATFAPAADQPAAKPTGPKLAVVDRVRFLPAPKRAEKMVGGKFAGSNESPTAGFVTLGEITSAPAEGQWTELVLTNTKPYRWVRYEAPAGSHGNVAELEFFAGKDQLRGQPFGTPASGSRSAVNGKPETFFNSSQADGQYTGLDLGDRAATSTVFMIPAPRDYDQPQQVQLKCPMPGATIRYSLDGTVPLTRESGLAYTGPIAVDKRTTIVAVAFAPGLARSADRFGTYRVGKSFAKPTNSFHVGNSLTGNAARFPMFAQTGGHIDNFTAFLIGGSLTEKLWRAKETDEVERWTKTWNSAKQPLDFFTVQPRDFDVDREVLNSIRFFDFVRATSPHVQPWIYAEWVEMSRQRPSDKGEVPSYQMKKLYPALTWEESMSAMLLYNEEVQHRIKQTYQGEKPPRIIPVDIAMGRARNMVDRGAIPGTTPGELGYQALLFDDHVHVNMAGSYLVDLCWYAAIYGESPVRTVLPVMTNLTSEQAAVLQDLAWDVVRNYPDCGLFEEGSQPVAAPTFSVAPGPLGANTPVTIHSATPGAWFRYTLDGTTPTRTRGYVSCGVVSVRPGMTVKAIGYKSGMADSEVTTGEYPAK